MAGHGAIIGYALGEALGGVKTVAATLSNVTLPNNIPDVSATLRLWYEGRITWERLRWLLRREGIYIDDIPTHPTVLSPREIALFQEVWGDEIESNRPKPTIEQLIDQFVSGYMGQDDFRKRAARVGWDPNKELSELVTLAVPTVSGAEWLRAARLYSDPDSPITRFGLNVGPQAGVKDALQKIGEPVLTSTVPSPPGTAPTWDWSDWARVNQWFNAGIGEGQEMLWRLRPLAGVPAGARLGNRTEFTEDDYRALLRLIGYPPYWIERLMAVAYRPMSVRIARQGVQAGIVSGRQLHEIARGEGLSDADTETFLAIESNPTQIKLLDSQPQRAYDHLHRGYVVGSISRDDAARGLYPLVTVGQDLRTVFAQSDKGAQLAIANSSDAVNFELNDWDAEIALADTERLIACARDRFKDGEVDKQGLTNLLTSAGITLARARQIADQEQACYFHRGKIASTADLLRWLRFGYMNAAQVTNRLVNLGWNVADIPLLLLDVQRDVSLDVARAQAQTARTLKEQQAAAAAAARVAAKQAAEAARQLAGKAGPGQLVKYYLSGLLTLAQVERRLGLLGWSANDIQLELDYASQQAALKQQGKAPKLKPVPPLQPKQPPAATVLKWLKAGLIDQNDALARLHNLGYTDGDAKIMLHGVAVPTPKGATVSG